MAWILKAPITLKTNHLAKHIIRAVLAFISLLCFIYGITRMPISQTYTLTFTCPLFLTALSKIFLKEKVDTISWLCVSIGFFGVVVAAKPDLNFFYGASFIALLGGCAYAASLMLIRDLSHFDSPITILLFFTIASVVFSLPFAFYEWPALSMEQWAELIFIGLLGGAAQATMVQAFCLAPASSLAPFDYLALLWAVGFDYCAFTCLPDWNVWIGAMLIVTAGLGMIMLKRNELAI